MWLRIRQLLSPPVVIGDEDKTRRAQILNTIIWFNFFVWLFALVTMPFMPQALLGVFVVGSLLIVAVIAVVVLKAGYIDWVSRGFVLFLWAASVGLIAVSGGIVNPEVSGLVIVVFAAGLLSGLQAALVITGMNLLAVIAITWLDSQNFLPILLPINPLVGLVVASVNLLLAAGFVWLALAGIAQSLARARKYAQELEVEQSQLEEHVRERTHSAEAALLEAENARKEAETVQYALEVQMWQINGQAQLNETLRGETDLQTLAERVIDFVCQYLQLPGGLFYVRYDNDLRMVGSYAYYADSDETNEFALGEGLVGQAAIEKRTLILDNMPETGLLVASGLGQCRPNTLLILPLLREGSVVGVIELLNLKSFSAQQVQFLERASESIAIAIYSGLAQQKMNVLLEETQRQAEELQAQEEELRAANEELLARSEM